MPEYGNFNIHRHDNLKYLTRLKLSILLLKQRQKNANYTTILYSPVGHVTLPQLVCCVNPSGRGVFISRYIPGFWVIMFQKNIRLQKGPLTITLNWRKDSANKEYVRNVTGYRVSRGGTICSYSGLLWFKSRLRRPVNSRYTTSLSRPGKRRNSIL